MNKDEDDLVSDLEAAIEEESLIDVKRIVRAAKKLINPDKVINNKTGFFSPLGIACSLGHVKIANYLIDQGAEVNIPCCKQFSPLVVVCSQKKKNRIQGTVWI